MLISSLIPSSITPVGVSLEGKFSIGTLLGTLQWIGIVVAVVMVLWVGIKYVTAGAGGKASVKGDLIPMLIGSAFIGLAIPIVRGVMHVFQVEI